MPLAPPGAALMDGMTQPPLPPQPAQIDPRAPVSITLAFSDWQLIARGVQELPMRLAVPLLQELERQVQAAPRAVQDGGNG